VLSPSMVSHLVRRCCIALAMLRVCLLSVVISTSVSIALVASFGRIPWTRVVPGVLTVPRWT